MKRDVKKVCFLLGGSKLSGAEKRTIISAIKLSHDDKYEIMLITSKELREEFYKSELNALNANGLKWKVRRYSKFKLRLFRVFYNFIYSIIYNALQLPFNGWIVHVVLFNKMVIVSSLLNRLVGSSKFYYEIVGPEGAESKELRLLSRYSFLYDKLVFVSSSVYERFLRAIRDSESISNIYVREKPLAFFLPSNKEEKKNNVVYAHRLIERKNPILATNAFIDVANKHPDWNFLICGDGDLKHKVAGLVNDCGLLNVKYLGYRYDVDKILKESKIFVSLIEPDNYPSQSVFNAMANRNALLISDTGTSNQHFIKNNGLLTTLNETMVVKNLVDLIEDFELEKKMDSSLSLYENEYSLENYIKDTGKIYS